MSSIEDLKANTQTSTQASAQTTAMNATFRLVHLAVRNMETEGLNRFSGIINECKRLHGSDVLVTEIYTALTMLVREGYLSYRRQHDFASGNNELTSRWFATGKPMPGPALTPPAAPKA